MFSILGGVLFGVIVAMTVLVACDLPLGEFTIDGQYKSYLRNLELWQSFQWLSKFLQ